MSEAIPQATEAADAEDRPHGGLPARYVLIGLGSGLLLLAAVLSLQIHPPTQSYRSVISTVCAVLGLACLVVAGLAIHPPPSWRAAYRRVHAFALAQTILLTVGSVAVFAGGAFLTLFVPLSRSIWSDVVSFTYVNTHLALSGQNPYLSDWAFPGALARFPNAIETPVRQGQFGTGYDYPSLAKIDAVRQQYVAAPDNSHGEFDPRTLHSYPALSFLVYVPLVWLGVDNILILNLLVFFALFAWLLWLSPVGWRHWGALIAGAATIAVLFSLFLETEVVCVALLLLAWHLRQRWSGAVLLGLACAFKQYSWFFLPFFLLDIYLANGGWRGWRETLRWSALAGGAFLVPNLPYIIASPVAWFTSLWVPMTASLFPAGMGFIDLATGHVLPYLPPHVYALLELAVLGAALWAYARWRHALADSALLLALIPMLFAFRSSPNYFAFAPWLALYAANRRYSAAGVVHTPAWAARARQVWSGLVALLVPPMQHAYAWAGLPAGDALVQPGKPAAHRVGLLQTLLPLEGQRRGDDEKDTPDGEHEDTAPHAVPWRALGRALRRHRAAQCVGQRRRWEYSRQRLQRAWQVINGQYHPADEQEEQEEPIGRRQRGFGPQRPRHQQAQAGEGGCAEQNDQRGHQWLTYRAPAVHARRERHQQRDLYDLDGEHREDFGGDQPPAWQRRAAQSLQHAVVALVGSSDAQADHARRHDCRGDHAGQEELDGLDAPGGGEIEGHGENQQPDGNDERGQYALAAAQRHRQLGARLGEDRLVQWRRTWRRYWDAREFGRSFGRGWGRSRCGAEPHSRISFPVRRKKTSSSDERPTRTSRSGT
jgi:hypothetical protein